MHLGLFLDIPFHSFPSICFVITALRFNIPSHKTLQPEWPVHLHVSPVHTLLLSLVAISQHAL